MLSDLMGKLTSEETGKRVHDYEPPDEKRRELSLEITRVIISIGLITNERG